MVTSTTTQRLILATILMTLNLRTTSSTSLTKGKSNARPVHEVINEQSRSDKQLKSTKIPVSLPYGNPLAGNANAKLHAQNQQAMFNAEKIRQHRAQLQRWTKAPIQMDSYMKAYQESQENHQIALEQAQTRLRDVDITSVQPPKKRHAQFRQETNNNKGLQTPEPTKITRDDAVIRSHRSYGSDYSNYLANKRYQSVYVSQAPDYEQGVTIKPHGNIGVSQLQTQEAKATKLYTKVMPSGTQYVYPKLHNQMQNYHSAEEYDALSSLLRKTPQDQLSQLTALLQSSKSNSQEKPKETDTNTPIDLYFYMKDTPSIQTLTQHYDESKYAQMPQNYADAYMNMQKDHTPITEDVEDIPDPNQKNRIKTYGVQQQIPNNQIQFEEHSHINPHYDHETTTVKSNNYYKVEVASQTITAGYKPTYSSKVKQPEYHISSEENYTPTHQALSSSYGSSASYPIHTIYTQSDTKHEDLNEVYLHHNAQHKGIHHLTDDGTGVSAYGDDSHNVSKRSSVTDKLPDNSNKKSQSNKKLNRQRRANLETDAFLVPNKTDSINPLTEKRDLLNKDSEFTNNTATAEALRFRIIRGQRPNKFGTHNTFLNTPEFPVGEAIDVSTDYDYDDRPHRKPQNHKFDPYDKLEAYDDEDDYEQDEDSITDFSSPDEDYGTPTVPSYHQNHQSFQTYAPGAEYNQNGDLRGSFSNRYKKYKRNPNIPQGFGGIHNIGLQNTFPQTSYGIPQTSYGIPQTSYGAPETSYGAPSFGNGALNIDHLAQISEPLYMLTESQLKKIVGHHNLNIEHLDLIQVTKEKNKPRPHYQSRPRKHRKRYTKPKHLKKNLYKLNKLLHHHY